MATIGILHMGLHGHLWPARRLGGLLARRGHRVIAWAPPRFRADVEAGAGEYRMAPGVQADDLHALGLRAPKNRRTGPPGQVDGDFRIIAAGRAALAAASAGELIEQLDRERVELLVHDCMMASGRIAGEWLGLPRVCSYPLFPPGPAGRVPAPGPPAPEVEQSLQAARYAVAERWGVDLGDFGDVMTNAGDVTCVYTTAEVSGVVPETPAWQMVGPLLGPPPAPDPALAPTRGRPLVYVAFGTLFSGRADFFRAVLDALAGEDVDVLVGTGGRLDPAELEPLPANARAMLLAPGRAALRHAAVHVTHGGISSIHESLEAGVPMVCLPQGSDQWAWGWRMDELGVGEMLAAETSPAGIRDAVMRMLAAEEPRARAARLAEHLRDYDGERIAVEAVEALLG